MIVTLSVSLSVTLTIVASMALAAITAALRPGEALLDALEIADDETVVLFLLLPGEETVTWSGQRVKTDSTGSTA